MKARDVMTTRFWTLRADDTIADAVNRFREASRKQGKNVFGMMVTDDDARLVGMLSMYDILVFVQPRHAGIWSELDDMDQAGLFDGMLARVKHIRVGDLMTPDVVTITPDTHLMAIVDLMIKRHIRRLPVVDQGDVVGMVYISDLFYHLLRQYLV
ncbi:putative signal transduction protein with CBS domain containing protein [Desulfosarcina cetonica]|uniref:CBS domain-containing protein n=1 Tax=Desulfosarcina cetonica TaxID=90730 RepID=UPI0006D2BC77|nr:CBS domain-containing protein [Desulfosarcina cetonica]VTR64092.1 putative signal transduction protein with CBS domain containing protein [Desulfosarcina cetonica]